MRGGWRCVAVAFALLAVPCGGSAQNPHTASSADEYAQRYLEYLGSFRSLMWSNADVAFPTKGQLKVSHDSGSWCVLVPGESWPTVKWNPLQRPGFYLEHARVSRQLCDRNNLQILLCDPPPTGLFEHLSTCLRNFLGERAYKDLLLYQVKPDSQEGTWEFLWRETFNGYPVWGSSEGFFRVFMHEKHGLLSVVDARCLDVKCCANIKINIEEAKQHALAAYEAASRGEASSRGSDAVDYPLKYLERPTRCTMTPIVTRMREGKDDLERMKAIASVRRDGSWRLCWRITVNDEEIQKCYGIEPKTETSIDVFVDTETGEIVRTE